MSVIQWKQHDSTAVLTMNNNANKWTLDFISLMNRTLDDILENPDIFSIIITSADPKNFSQGIDIDWLGNLFSRKDSQTIRAFLYECNDLFKRCLLFPVPVIAAINGHAFGNGAMLACACDFRFMNMEKGFFCFPEVDINIPFLPGMVEFARKAIPEYKFNEMKLSGRRLGAKELEACHVLEKASSGMDALLEDALAFAGLFRKQRPIFAEHKRRMHKKIIETIDTEDPKYIEPMKLFL